MNMTDRFLLRINCPGRNGLVAAVTGFLADQDYLIPAHSQFDDIQTSQFFCRTECCKPESGLAPAELSNLSSTSDECFEMDWKFIDLPIRHRTLILISRFDHCLNDLLSRKQASELSIDVTNVAFNHPDLGPLARLHQVPFEALPARQSKLAAETAQEERIRDLIERQGVDLVVLARYMQVLSDKLRQDLAGRYINIHHSFLSSLKGARPYHQAYKRGVKAIGAAAHDVTIDLDEGQIIDQEVARVGHTVGSDQLLATGRNIENYTLSRAVKAHSEHRVFVNGYKTVVLK